MLTNAHAPMVRIQWSGLAMATPLIDTESDAERNTALSVLKPKITDDALQKAMADTHMHTIDSSVALEHKRMAMTGIILS